MWKQDTAPTRRLTEPQQVSIHHAVGRLGEITYMYVYVDVYIYIIYVYVYEHDATCTRNSAGVRRVSHTAEGQHTRNVQGTSKYLATSMTKSHQVRKDSKHGCSNMQCQSEG